MLLSRRKIIHGVLGASSLLVSTAALSKVTKFGPSLARSSHSKSSHSKSSGAGSSGTDTNIGLGQIFGSSSFWYQSIPANAILHSDSANLVKNMVAQAAYAATSLNTSSWNAPIYVVGPDAPTTPVANVGTPDSGLSNQWQAVPIPSYAQPSNDSDAEMVIYQPSLGMMWDFWVAANVNGLWQAKWGGGMSNVSTSNGIWPKRYGATATGLPLIGGQITAAELQAGQINHVMGISLIQTANWDILSWPALRGDGWNDGHFTGSYPPEGARFRLDPSFNYSGLGLHPVAAMIAKAAQTYGFVIWDRAGSVSLRAENPLSFTLIGKPNPFDALYGGTPSYQILKNFPWDHMQFMPVNYGTS